MPFDVARLRLVIAAVLPLAAGCSTPATTDESSEVELAVPMAQLHHFTTKLGFSVAARNRPLAGFYLDEVDEVFAGLAQVEEYEGMPIARSIEVIIDPLRADLRREIEAERWPEAQDAYRELVTGCNRCHAATEHEFLVILPATGEPPFFQQFAPR